MLSLVGDVVMYDQNRILHVNIMTLTFGKDSFCTCK